MPEYQVWHKHGNRYDKVAEVETVSPRGAWIETTHLTLEAWPDNPGVTAIPGNHRSTTLGDIIIDPEGKEFRLEKNEREIPDFTEVTTIFDQGFGESLATMAIEDAAAIGFDPTGVDGYLSTERDPIYHEPTGRDFEVWAAIPPKPIDPEMDALLTDLEKGWEKQAARPIDRADDYDRMLTLAAMRPANDNQERGRER